MRLRSPSGAIYKTLLKFLSELTLQNRVMLSRMSLSLVTNLADVDWIGQ